VSGGVGSLYDTCVRGQVVCNRQQQRSRPAHQHAGGERERRLGQAAAVHERDCGRPVAVAVQQRAQHAAVQDACGAPRRGGVRRTATQPRSAEWLPAAHLTFGTFPATAHHPRAVLSPGPSAALALTRERAVLWRQRYVRLQPVPDALAGQVQAVRVAGACGGVAWQGLNAASYEPLHNCVVPDYHSAVRHSASHPHARAPCTLQPRPHRSQNTGSWACRPPAQTPPRPPLAGCPPPLRGAACCCRG
jgi:hypothetical protein